MPLCAGLYLVHLCGSDQNVNDGRFLGSQRRYEVCKTSAGVSYQMLHKQKWNAKFLGAHFACIGINSLF